MSTDIGREHHEGMHARPYIVIFIALAVFTAISFIINGAEKADGMFGRALISAETAFALILGVAVVKALLVATFFMHLRVDWRRVYVVVIPGLLLAGTLIIALWPDMVFAWR